MNTGLNPYKVVKMPWHKWICEGPWQSGSQWNSQEEAQKECDLLNSVYNTGYDQNPDQRKLRELECDIAHAYSEAKKWVPDYPWNDKNQTASIAVWACGTSYAGVSKACDDLHKLLQENAPHIYKIAEQDLQVKKKSAKIGS